MNAEEDASASTGCSLCHPQARVPAGYMSAGVIPESVTCQRLWTNRASHGRPGRVEIDGTSCAPAVSFSDSLPFSYLRADGFPMTATPWLRLRSFLPTGSGLYAGHAARVRRFVAALCRGRPRAAPWPDEYGKGRGLSVRRVRPRRPVAPDAYRANPDRFAVRRNSTFRRAPKKADPVLDRSRGGFRTQIPILADR